MSRAVNSIKNAGTGIGMELIDVLLRFLCRTVFIYVLGKEYLGISSLYSNVLTILNIAELGFSAAITYSLYRPLAEKNQEQICSLMAYYKKVYRLIGFVILGMGMILMPFLPHLMSGVTDRVNIYQYYLLYLMQAVVSYWFFSYKSVLLLADQKKYISDIIAALCRIVLCLLQVMVLLLLQSFFAYTVLAIAMNIVQNIFTAWQTDKRYPYLKQKAQTLSEEDKKGLLNQVHALFLQKISTAIGTATDNLIISAFVSVLHVGLYNNYDMIISVVQKFLKSLFQGMTASLGNLFVSESKERSAFIFRSLNLANSCMVCISSVCFLALFQPFITLWIGQEYLLDSFTVFIVVMNFTTNYLQNVVLHYRNAAGLFVIGRYRSVVNAALNLLLSLIFVQVWGMSGVLIGSIVSRLATNWWFDAYVLYKKGFGKSPMEYYLHCGICILIILLSWSGIEYVMRLISCTAFMQLILRGIMAVLCPSLLCLLLYGRSREFAYLQEQTLYLTKKLLHRF